MDFSAIRMKQFPLFFVVIFVFANMASCKDTEAVDNLTTSNPMGYTNEYGSSSTSKDPKQCQTKQAKSCDPSYPYRTIDGSCNNLAFPTWGITKECFLRFQPAFYDGFGGFRRSVTGNPLPQPRDLILNIFKDVHRPSSKVSFTFTVYGQTIAHDMSLADFNQIVPCCKPESTDNPICADISIRPNDPFYSQFNKTCLKLHRTPSCPVCTAKKRQQINAVTSAVDVSIIYGSEDSIAKKVRANDGTGKLLANQTENGELLTIYNDTAPVDCPLHKNCFFSGDDRVNQHASLSAMQTLFMREHNRIASKLKKMNPQWNEETLYQESRRINIATVQCFIYKEYLPILLGPYIMEKYNLSVKHDSDASKYNPHVRLGVWNEFGAAGFRLHSMIPSKIGALGLRFKDTYNNQKLIIDGNLDKMVQGEWNVPSEKYDHYYVTDVTDYLALVPGAGFGFDLGSIDIQRGRDHGLAPYIVMVKFCSEGQVTISTFDDLAPLLMTKRRAEILEKNYEAVEDIDLWVGVQMEHKFPESEVGPTAACMIAKQFHASKFGDRFYFEHKNEVPSFTTAQRNSLKQCSLSRLFCDNSNIMYVQKNVMLLPSSENPEVPCEDIPKIDLTYWKQTA